MGEYKLVLSVAYLREGWRRAHAQLLRRPWLLALKIVCFVGLVLLLGVSVFSRIYMPAVIFAFFLALLLLSSRLDGWYIAWRHRKSPLNEQPLSFRVSPEGVFWEIMSSHGLLTWPLITKARRFSDGTLVFLTPTQYYWLPDSAIVAGDPSAVWRQLVDSVPDHREV